MSHTNLDHSGSCCVHCSLFKRNSPVHLLCTGKQFQAVPSAGYDPDLHLSHLQWLFVQARLKDTHSISHPVALSKDLAQTKKQQE